jgi:hypothetical protein
VFDVGYFISKCCPRVDSIDPNSPRAILLATSFFRELDMRIVCLPRGRILLLVLFIGCHIPLIGCNDESKTSGTMVQVSDEDKARLITKREKYKELRPKGKAKAVDKTGTPSRR